MTTRQQLENAYGLLLNHLESYSERINQIKGINDDFLSIQCVFLDSINAKIEESKKQLKESIEDTVWDNLVIAFFGETNAGKSTIIETFRILFDDNRIKEDGLIVGDGSQDFTKAYEEYKLSIDGYPFTLIDVPGIEGNEAEYKEGIKSALHKAHCVFYVQGHNKKPDAVTAEKIKQYLGDWVKVYSIYNVRGAVSNYDELDERKSLFSQSVVKNESLIEETLRSILGNVYEGNMTIQALLAMCAKAQFSERREDLRNNQTKLLKYFSNADEILRFSQFQTIINLIEEKSKNFSAEIMEANKQKMISLINRITTDFNAEIVKQSNRTGKLSDLLRSFKCESNQYILDCKSAINRLSKREIEKQLDALKESIYRILDNDDIGSEEKKRRIEIEQNEKKDAINKGLTNIINSEWKNMKTKLDTKRKSLNDLNFNVIMAPSFSNFGPNIDFDGAIEELDFNFDDFSNGAAKTLGSAAAGAGIGSVICPGIGTIIGGVIGGLGGLIASAITGRDRKSTAKDEVRKAIEKEKERTIFDLENALAPIMNKLDLQSLNIKKLMEKESENILLLQKQLQSFQNDSEVLLKEIKNADYGTI